MKLYINYITFVASMLISCTVSAQEVLTIDFTNCESVVWDIDALSSSKHAIVIDDYYDRELVAAAKVLVGDDLILVDENIYDVRTGKLVRGLSQTKYLDAVRTDGLSALMPTNAELDSEGRYLYALGIHREDGYRYHYMKKLDFNTGQVLDSIDYNGFYIALDQKDNLLKQEGDMKGFEALFPDIRFIHEPTYSLYRAPRYSKRYTYFICYSNAGKNLKYYVYDTDTKKLMQITGIKSGGKVLPLDGLVGINKNYLAYAEPIDSTKKLSVTIYTMK